MIRDITIGQYYLTDSVIHKLDPRVKVVCTFAYIISLFCFNQLSGYIIAAVFFLCVIKLSKVPFKFVVRGIKPVLFMLVFTAMLNLFWTSGGNVIVKFGIITITEEGIERTVFMALRLIFLIIGSSIMTLTTTPNQLTDAIEKLLKPLNRVKVPVHEVAMMMSIALRFIPILVEETDKILKDEKKFVGIYPEAALWPYYTKIRKFKPGAFHFAVKDDVPIIPVVINFRAPRGIQKWFNMKVRYVTVHIGKPIYANKDLPFNESVAELMERSHNIMVRMNHWFKVIDEGKVQAQEKLNDDII